MRSFARLVSNFSVYGMVRLGSTLSVHREEIFRSASGSALSVYRTARVGCSIGFVDFIQLGSTSSLRAFVRLGSGLAVYGMSRLVSSISIFDYILISSFLRAARTWWPTA